MKTTFDANLYRTVHAFVSKEETRYYLCGVSVRPHHTQGVVLCATDGHKMLVAHDINGTWDGYGHDGKTQEVIVALEPHMIRECKPKKGETRTVTVELEGSGTTSPKTLATITRTTEGAPPQDMCTQGGPGLCVDGTFPDYERVIPNAGEKLEVPTFNASYVGVFAKAFAELGKDTDEGGPGLLKIVSRDNGGAALVLAPNSPHVFGVLMPVRDKSPHTVPAWFAKPSKAAKEFVAQVSGAAA